MSSPLDMLRLLAMSQAGAPKGAEPMTYERTVSRYDPARGDLRAADSLFLELCTKANRNAVASANGTARISGSTFENLEKHPAPASLVEAAVAEMAEARIFTKSGGSVIFARIDRESGSIVPYEIRESKTRHKSYWFSTATDTYRFEADDAEQARTMFEAQVPEANRRGQVSVNVQEDFKDQADDGSPFTITISNERCERRTVLEIPTIARAFSIAVSETAAGEKTTITDKDHRLIFEHEGQAAAQPGPSAPEGMPNIPAAPGKMIVMMAGEAIGLTEATGSTVLLRELGSGANMSDQYLIVDRVADHDGHKVAVVREAVPGVLTQADKDKAVLITDIPARESVLNESSTSEDGLSAFLEGLAAAGFRGLRNGLGDALFGDGLIYSEALGLGVAISAGTPPSLWNAPIYRTFKADPAKLHEKIASMPQVFFESEGSDTLQRYMAGYDPVKAVSDVMHWTATCLNEKAMGPDDVLARISSGHDSRAALHADTLVKMYGIDEAETRVAAKLRKFIDEFPEDQGLQQYWSTVRSRIAKRRPKTEASAEPTPILLKGNLSRTEAQTPYKITGEVAKEAKYGDKGAELHVCQSEDGTEFVLSPTGGMFRFERMKQKAESANRYSQTTKAE